MKKHFQIFLLVSLFCISLSFATGSVRFHLQSHPETKPIRWATIGTYLANPIALPQERLFGYVQNQLDSSPTLVDFQNGKVKELDALKKHGFAKRKGTYAFGEDNCLYLAIKENQPKIARYCLQTGSFDRIPLEKVVDPPFSFVVRKDGTIYGVLPITRQDTVFRVVQFDPHGKLLAEKTFPVEGGDVFLMMQPRIRRFLNHNFIFYRDRVYVLNEALELQKMYTLNLPDSNGSKVFDIVPFQDASTFLMVVTQRNPVTAAINVEHLIVWQAEDGHIEKIDTGALHGKSILALSSDGRIYWGEPHQLGIMKVQAERELMAK